ncbi:hypothetical protein GCM10008931_40200 [Oceanobacillus oncorhynchi subsp. oncorhynchi]
MSFVRQIIYVPKEKTQPYRHDNIVNKLEIEAVNHETKKECKRMADDIFIQKQWILYPKIRGRNEGNG